MWILIRALFELWIARAEMLATEKVITILWHSAAVVDATMTLLVAEKLPRHQVRGTELQMKKVTAALWQSFDAAGWLTPRHGIFWSADQLPLLLLDGVLHLNFHTADT